MLFATGLCSWSDPLVRTNESESRRLCGSPVCTSKRAMKPTAPTLRASSASMRRDLLEYAGFDALTRDDGLRDSANGCSQRLEGGQLDDERV